jgi:hypothetical protein
VDHAVDAGIRCAPALVGVRVELLLGENVTASLSDELVSGLMHMFQWMQRIPHTKRKPC